MNTSTSQPRENRSFISRSLGICDACARKFGVCWPILLARSGNKQQIGKESLFAQQQRSIKKGERPEKGPLQTSKMLPERFANAIIKYLTGLCLHAAAIRL